MNDNGEDGMRFVSIEDKADVYRRRVGGMDLDISSMNTQYSRNVKDGVHLGQGVSAVFGDGTIDNANYFEENGRNGFLVTQHNSPYLDNLGRRRHVQVNRAFFQFNGDNGLDIGIDPFQEGGNTSTVMKSLRTSTLRSTMPSSARMVVTVLNISATIRSASPTCGWWTGRSCDL